MNKVIRLAISGLLLAWIASKTDWQKVQSAFVSLQIEYWLAATVLLVVTQIVSAVRWQVFANALRFDCSLPKLTSFYFIGMYFNLLLPTSVGGDAVRAWYLNGHSGRKLASIASVLLDRVNGVMVLVALAIVAVFLTPVEMPTWIPASVAGIAAAGVLGTLGLTLIAYLGKLPPNRQQQLQTMVGLLNSPALLAKASALSLFVQGANVVLVWLISLGLGLDVPLTYYGILVPMVSLLTMLPVSLNGMGVREWGTALFLAPFGVAEGPALALAILWFAVQLAGSLLGGLVYLMGHFAKPAPAAEDETDDAVLAIEQRRAA